MPVVKRLEGFRFFFYANEGHPLEPAHVHVHSGRDEAKFWLRPGIVQAYNHGFNARTINRIQRLVEAWNEYFS